MPLAHLLPWRKHGPEPREAMRLALVAAAAEMAVLARLIHAELAPVSTQSAAIGVQRRCSEHESAAIEMLSPKTRFEEMSNEHLLRDLRAFQARLKDARALRVRVKKLAAGRWHKGQH